MEVILLFADSILILRIHKIKVKWRKEISLNKLKNTYFEYVRETEKKTFLDSI